MGNAYHRHRQCSMLSFGDGLNAYSRWSDVIRERGRFMWHTAQSARIPTLGVHLKDSKASTGWANFDPAAGSAQQGH